VNNKYPVNDVYYTIQGEGVLTGTPAIFLRLHGCPVGCPFCDTKETWEMTADDEVASIDKAHQTPQSYTWQTTDEIVAYLKQQWEDALWVVITGGEPALYDLKALVSALQTDGKKVAIETSGTADGHVHAGFDWVTVSPKINMPGKLPILPEAMAVANEVKHVVGRMRDIEELDKLLIACPPPVNATICLQPMSQSAKATELAIKMSKARNWRLSIQVHKYIAIP
jgi:7-carboxy-7-deazaguanine synthase